jgi:hypothetical protein
MSFSGAVIAGLAATFVVYISTRLTTVNQMGMERFFSGMFTRQEHPRLGFLLLYLFGALLGLVYAALWSVEIGWPDYLYGFIFGVFQWLIFGLAMGALPLFHSGIRSGAIPAPGAYMYRLLGPWALIAGLTNHVLFGFIVAYVYQFFRSRYG